MPELPDLYVFAENIKKAAVGKRITEAAVYHPEKLNVPAETFIDGVSGAAIIDVYNEGKEMFYKLDNGHLFSVHLMLNGKLILIDADKREQPNDRIASLCFDNNFCLSICDLQRYAKITLDPPKSKVPSALSEGFSEAYFMAKADKMYRKNVKAFLLDQRMVRGIGNAYADEILYHANISPKSITGEIPEDVLLKLYASIKDVLNWAIVKIKEITPDAISGEERGFLRVHNPNMKKTAKGERILKDTIASKKTYFTDSQKFYM